MMLSESPAGDLEADVTEAPGNEQGAARRSSPARGRFVPDPECALITSDGDSTLLAGHHFVGDGVAHEPYRCGSLGPPVDLNHFARRTRGRVGKQHRDRLAVPAASLLGRAIVPDTPAEPGTKPKGRLHPRSVPPAIAQARALGVIQGAVLRGDAPGRTVTVG